MIYQQIAYRDPVAYFDSLQAEPWSLLFDSGGALTADSRYSYIAVQPFSTLVSKAGAVYLDGQLSDADPFTLLQQQLKYYADTEMDDNLPPFQGGAAGHLAYDLRLHLEKLPCKAEDKIGFYDMAIGFYDLLLAFDRQRQQAWIVSTGLPEQMPQARQQRAQQRLVQLQQRLGDVGDQAEKDRKQAPLPSPISNLGAQAYQQSVQKAIDYILAGDVFEVNVSQRFQTTLPEDYCAYTLYKRLRQSNPAPFAAYLHYGDEIIASSSPELFLQLRDREVLTRPIKGTCARDDDPLRDAERAKALSASEKDRAENIMIVDLMRNDLSKVCRPGTVEVPSLCAVQTFATVHHLVSTVKGNLEQQYDAVDVLRATFPGGSITGAPKIRAMEIIDELEPTRRGPYCGSALCIGFNGTMQSSILIRTMAIRDNQLCYQAGGAVLADSQPKAEYDESMLKARALTAALTMENIEDMEDMEE